jgi:hypothetical protein
LNKLEKQLRASRGREVPDLTPPTGGWEAINAELGTDPAGERAPVYEQTVPSLIKWWGSGVGVLLLVLVAALMPLGGGAPAEQALGLATEAALAVAKAEVADVEGITEFSEQKEEQQMNEKVIRNNEVTDSPASVKPDKTIKPAGKTMIAGQGDKVAVEQKVVVEQQREPVGSNRSSVKAADNNGAATDIPVTAPALSGKEGDGEESIVLDTSQLRTVAPEAKPEVFADSSGEVYLPLELPSTLSGLTLVDQWPTGVIPVVHRKLSLFKSRRSKARPEWQFHGSISGFIGEDYDGTLAYDVAPPGGSGIFFVRPSGGLIHVESDAVRGNSNRLEQIYIKAGINRQTSSGFLFRTSVGVVRSKSFQGRSLGMLTPDEVEVKKAKDETIVPVEIGLQYTFLRRRRIKPYAGVHLVGYLNYLGAGESYFTEGATAEEGLVSRFSSQEFIALIPDLAVTLGLQYQISRKISAGVFLWGNIGGTFFVQAPFGVEVRYSLK